MQTHLLKTTNPFFEDVRSGIKVFDVRKNDRNFQVGDNLTLQEFDPNSGYLSRVIKAEITYILQDHEGLRPGYVVLGIRVVQHDYLSQEAIEWFNEKWKTKSEK